MALKKALLIIPAFALVSMGFAAYADQGAPRQRAPQQQQQYDEGPSYDQGYQQGYPQQGYQQQGPCCNVMPPPPPVFYCIAPCFPPPLPFPPVVMRPWPMPMPMPPLYGPPVLPPVGGGRPVFLPHPTPYRGMAAEGCRRVKLDNGNYAVVSEIDQVIYVDDKSEEHGSANADVMKAYYDDSELGMCGRVQSGPPKPDQVHNI